MTNDSQGGFEEEVLSIVKSLSQSNMAQSQHELTELFKMSEIDDDMRSYQASYAHSLGSSLMDEVKTMVLLSAVLEVRWPEWNRGDGYFTEPSLLGSFATRLGLSSKHSELLEVSNHLSPCKFLGFFDLGIVANRQATSAQVMAAVNRSSLDPVLAIAASAESLTPSQVREILARLESGSLLIDAILRLDGWNWPEFQDAFGLASSDLNPTETLWEVLLSEVGEHLRSNSSSFRWMFDFLDQAGEDFWESSEDVLDLIRATPKLRQLAEDSQWLPLTSKL